MDIKREFKDVLKTLSPSSRAVVTCPYAEWTTPAGTADSGCSVSPTATYSSSGRNGCIRPTPPHSPACFPPDTAGKRLLKKRDNVRLGRQQWKTFISNILFIYQQLTLHLCHPTLFGYCAEGGGGK